MGITAWTSRENNLDMTDQVIQYNKVSLELEKYSIFAAKYMDILYRKTNLHFTTTLILAFVSELNYIPILICRLSQLIILL